LAADVTLGRYNRVAPLKAPRHALSLEKPGTAA
jgi:hypothetical protein